MLFFYIKDIYDKNIKTKQKIEIQKVLPCKNQIALIRFIDFSLKQDRDVTSIPISCRGYRTTKQKRTLYQIIQMP